MGVSESKLISFALKEACRDAENVGKSQISDILLKPEVMNSARLLWAAIPLDARRRIGRPPKTSTRATPRQPKQLNSSELSFPPAFLATIQRWENDPLSFFKESNFEIGSTSSALVQIYIYMEDLELRKEKDLVRSRFMKVLYYRLKDRLCLTYVRANDVETVAQIISKTGMARSEPETIQKNISKWIKEGRKIDALCKDVNTVKSLENTHLGVLFCLPQDIHDEFIRALPLSGSSRDEEIRRLKDRGILSMAEKERVDALAAKIFDFLWDRVESSIEGLRSDLDSNWALQHTQSFQLQTARGPESDAPNTSSCISSPNLSVQSSLPEPPGFPSQSSIPIISGPLDAGDGPRNREPDISGAPDGVNSSNKDKVDSLSLKSRQKVHRHQSIPCCEPYNTDFTESHSYGNIPESLSSVIASDVNNSVESPNLSITEGAHSYAMSGIQTSYNLLEDGQQLAGPQYAASHQPHDMSGIQASYNLLEDGQQLAGPQYAATQHEQSSIRVESAMSPTITRFQNPDTHIQKAFASPSEAHGLFERSFPRPVLST